MPFALTPKISIVRVASRSARRAHTQPATRRQRASSSADTCCTPPPSTRAWTAVYSVPVCHCEPAEHHSAGTATSFADALADHPLERL
ncbi:hypothetical protein PF001_g14170 [Phytophthora fragariae]|uniref:Uncharacterized protein n=1 Tax=Phytophthora fragariae TaxID=53985 RepID=A0A6A4DGR0_9STRA|nr:hypothetical protein PF001_g14170 [Phytophthora fragariae]